MEHDHRSRSYGLIGFPLGHSFSVPYFTRKFEQEGMEASYANYPMESAEELLPLLQKRHDIVGLNVTIPHKKAVIPFLDELEAVAREIGAVNTIKVRRDAKAGHLHLAGYNTDVRGFERSLKEQMDPSGQGRGKGPVPGGEKALVLGTGGSSRAVVFVLKKLGMEVLQVSRRRGQGLLSYADLDARLLSDSSLIVNTTPLGMHPQVDTCPELPYEALGPEQLLFDLVYNPECTLFLQKGREQGARTANGHDMLVYQAEASWKIWNQKD